MWAALSKLDLSLPMRFRDLYFKVNMKMNEFLPLAILLLIPQIEARPLVSDFGRNKSGEVVQLITLKNSRGMSAEILTYGATIKALNVLDRDGEMGNVVLSTDSIEKFEKFNASASVIGRVANRIAGASFELNGKIHQLTANAGKNSLHGGKPGFARVVWKLEGVKAEEEGESVTLSYLSLNGEAGFPGNLKTKVTYTLTEKNELRVDYHAKPDRPTLVNLTNHAYFNFSGKETVLDHELWIPATTYTPTNQQGIPTGEIFPVDGTPMDFTKPTSIGKRIEELKPAMKGYDHNYVLGPAGKMKLAARLSDPNSGRVMEVKTTQPGMQLYSGNHLGRRAVCLETQHYPDSVHHAHFPSTVVLPDKDYRETVIFAFSVK